MRRRQFIASMLGAPFAWPLGANAQQSALPTVGFALSSSPPALRQELAAFEDGMKETGYVGGQNATIEYRFAEGQFDRFPQFVSEFINRGVSVIVVASSAGVYAAKKATSTIPIVFSIGDDPLGLGMVPSLNRPGGNMTGVYHLSSELEEKRLGLLHELVPKASTLSVLLHPKFASYETQLRSVRESAARLGVQLIVVRANAESEFEAAFLLATQQKAQGILVAASPFFNSKRQQLVDLAARHGLPAIYEWREFAEAGGLMSYGTRLAEAYRQAGVYAGRVLKGDKPADLPVVQVTKFEFVINLRTAKALGVEVPPLLSARADEVIE
jgi:putative tryptophan/tyrosine transport system substrate-binding protein